MSSASLLFEEVIALIAFAPEVEDGFETELLGVAANVPRGRLVCPPHFVRNLMQVAKIHAQKAVIAPMQLVTRASASSGSGKVDRLGHPGSDAGGAIRH